MIKYAICVKNYNEFNYNEINNFDPRTFSGMQDETVIIIKTDIINALLLMAKHMFDRAVEIKRF